MNIELVTPRWDEKVERYERHFHWVDDPNCGFSFPCDKNGRVIIEEMHRLAQENFEMCVANDGSKLADDGIQDWSYYIKHKDTRRCECGELIEMWGDSMGEVGCEHCGRVYNIFGQRLKGFTEEFVGMNGYGEYYGEDY